MKLFCYYDSELKQWGLPFASQNSHTASRDLLRLASHEEHTDGISMTGRFCKLFYVGEYDQNQCSFVEKPKKEINWMKASNSLNEAIEEEGEINNAE